MLIIEVMTLAFGRVSMLLRFVFDVQSIADVLAIELVTSLPHDIIAIPRFYVRILS